MGVGRPKRELINGDMIICNSCHDIKSLSCFNKSKYMSRGVVGRCKECLKLERKENDLAIKNRRIKYSLSNRDKIRAKDARYRQENREAINFRKRERRKRVAGITHTLKEISTIFINKCWPYTTDGKDEVSKEMREIMGDISPVQKNSFLSMPNLGRELNLLQDVIRFEDSVGIERDSKLFRSIQRAFAKFFPTMKVEKDCIDKYSINTDKVFDVAHLDYNGYLTTGHIEAAKKLVSDGTMTFLTVNTKSRFEKFPHFESLDKIREVGNIVFEKEYFGKKKCPMITLGITT